MQAVLLLTCLSVASVLPDVLQETEQILLHRKECNQRMQAKLRFHRTLVRKGMICGYHEKMKSPCKGARPSLMAASLSRVSVAPAASRPSGLSRRLLLLLLPQLLLLISGYKGDNTKPACGKPWWLENSDVTRHWPWEVSLRVEDEHVCGGALIDLSWVVTAAHCIQSTKEYSVILGTSKLKPKDAMKALSIPVKDIILHPKYWGRTFIMGDVALLQLHTPAIFSKYVQPICLPEPSYNLKVGTQCWVTGWGQVKRRFSANSTLTPELREAEVFIMDNKRCDRIYRKNSLVPRIVPLVLGDMICATNYGENMCYTNISCKNVKGKLVEVGKWPWQVSILFMGMNICGGSIIHHQWVLTAAHCLYRSKDPKAYSVKVGVQHISEDGTELSVTHIAIHEDFNNLISQDIALLKLGDSISWSPLIQPVCLPTPKLKPSLGSMCWVIGWARTDTKVTPQPSYSLQEVAVKIINKKICHQQYKFLFLKDQKKFIGNDMMCAASQWGMDMCQVRSVWTRARMGL
ncbi:Serine protease 45 [Camelus dromedarius]|uniref:Serine protease 45 n=1 Tax=Camelus dromedarius TaxID=9838 RepID=A0A5N4CYJ6_CAMDR|nr:Serine protease 45 [Camelus dromedarius]